MKAVQQSKIELQLNLDKLHQEKYDNLQKKFNFDKLEIENRHKNEISKLNSELILAKQQFNENLTNFNQMKQNQLTNYIQNSQQEFDKLLKNSLEEKTKYYEANIEKLQQQFKVSFFSHYANAYP
jgi:hypothetical protein